MGRKHPGPGVRIRLRNRRPRAAESNFSPQQFVAESLEATNVLPSRILLFVQGADAGVSPRLGRLGSTDSPAPDNGHGQRRLLVYVPARLFRPEGSGNHPSARFVVPTIACPTSGRGFWRSNHTRKEPAPKAIRRKVGLSESERCPPLRGDRIPSHRLCLYRNIVEWAGTSLGQGLGRRHPREWPCNLDRVRAGWI